MIRYTSTALGSRPPAPFIYVTLRNPVESPTREVKDFPAQLDSAADRTVIPTSLVGQLGLVVFDSLLVAGLGGVTVTLSTYLVVIEPRGLPPGTIEAVAAEEPWVLVGRDVLNLFRTMLDGPGKAVEIA